MENAAMTGADAIAIIVLLIILVAVGVYLLHWLYRHSSKDEAFVRTGLGGEKVVMGGGAFVVPIVHDVTRVNMNTVPLEIKRAGGGSLITRNKMRVDVVGEFSVRVIPTRESVSLAARALGERTASAELIKEVVQGRFVDAMSTVAATMTMDEMHVGRKQFMRQVSDIVAPTLASHGLELENASLTNLNQADITVFNPDNAFDAEGLTQLTQEIEERRKLRNRIENDTRLEIKLKDYETEQRAIEIDRDLEYARIDQTRDIEGRRAAQLAAIEDERSSSAISVSNAKVRAEQESERIRIAKDKLIDAERINSQTEIRLLEIDRQKDNEERAIETSKALETQRIASRTEVESRRIENDRKIKEFEITSRQDVSIIESNASARVDQTRLESERLVEASRIEIAKAIESLAVERDRHLRVINELAETEKEKAAILKRYNVDLERLKRDEEIIQLEIDKNQKVKLSETAAYRKIEDAAIVVGRELDELRIAARKFVEKFEIERNKEVEIIDKERLIAVINKSIEEAVAKTEAANAMKILAASEEQIVSARDQEAAERGKRIALIEAAARTEREAQRLISMAAAEKEATEQRALAEVAEANAAAVRYEKEAEGQTRLNEAENMRSDAARRSAIYENLVKNLPNIIRETVKPMENIESIKILQVDGVPGINSPSETMGAGVTNGSGGDGGNMTDRVVNSAMKYRTQVAFVDGLMKDLGLPIESIGSAGGMSFRNFQPPEKPQGGAPRKLGKSGKDDD
jgi:uncharacterized membrane protein YqiK